MSISADDVDRLRELEESLWRSRTRFDRVHMDTVFASDFVEVGASGRLHDREAVLGASARELDVDIPLADFSVRAIGPDAALVTYVSVERSVDSPTRRAFRLSVWMREDTVWKLVLHQGTIEER